MVYEIQCYTCTKKLGFTDNDSNDLIMWWLEYAELRCPACFEELKAKQKPDRLFSNIPRYNN